MLTGLNRKEIKEYITTQDGGDNPTKFLIGNLLHSERMTFLGSVLIPSGEKDKDGKIALNMNVAEFNRRSPEIVKAGLKGIKNFFDAEQSKVVDIDVITDEVIEKIPLTAVYEIAGKIIEWNCLQGAEQKN